MAEEEKDKEESEDEEGEAPSGRPRARLLLGLAAVLLVLAGAGIGFVVFSGLMSAFHSWTSILVERSDLLLNKLETLAAVTASPPFPLLSRR